MKIVSFVRNFVVYSTIFILLSVIIFFAAGPTFGVPLDHNQSFQAAKLISPVFIGYLAQATFYVTSNQRSSKKLAVSERGLFIATSIAPIVIFILSFTTIIWAFIVSNGSDAPPGTGMSFARFTDWITILLGLYTATVSVLTAWLFSSGQK